MIFLRLFIEFFRAFNHKPAVFYYIKPVPFIIHAAYLFKFLIGDRDICVTVKICL